MLALVALGAFDAPPEPAYTMVLDPDPRLRQVSRPVREDEFGPALVAHTDLLLLAMKEQEGVGLASVQIGDLRRILVVELEGETYRMVNPVVTGKSKMKMHYDERCLSVPGRARRMARARQVTVEWRTPEGETRSKSFMGYDAIVVQHELDHLDGKTIA